MAFLPANASYTHAQTLSEQEYTLKAVFLLNFAKFIDWPETARPKDQAILNICIVGDRRLNELFMSIHGKTASGRVVNVILNNNINNIPDMANCHILYLCSSDIDLQTKILESLRGRSILTVGETRGFCSIGGIVNFFKEAGRVRFEINPDTAQSCNIKISAKLLNVARLVMSGSQPGSKN